MATTTPVVAPARSQLQTNLRKYRNLYLMLLPGIVFLLVFHYVPMYGIIVAFKEVNLRLGILGSPWVGLANFHRLFTDSFGDMTFGRVLSNTITISVLRMTVGFVAPIVLALMLNEVRISAYKRSVQTMTYLPFFLSWVILGGIFLMLFAESKNAPINNVLMQLANLAKPLPFLSKGDLFVPVLIITGIWQSAGYGAVIYLAALSGIDPTLYEAAMVDGANRWKQTLHITLPCLLPTVIVLLILNAGHILNAGFDQIYNMYNMNVAKQSEILDTFVLKRMYNMDYGLATAAGLFKSMVGLGMIVLVNTIAKKLTKGEQGVW
jgi:putative aldouronate transport system permease protein